MTSITHAAMRYHQCLAYDCPTALVWLDHLEHLIAEERERLPAVPAVLPVLPVLPQAHVIGRDERVIPVEPPEPPPTPLAWWQLHANRIGKTVLVLNTHYRVSTNTVEPCIEYSVAEEDASEWEKNSATARYEPLEAP